MKKIILSGFGGQGVLFIGDTIAYTAMREGKEVTWVPSYGPESRGGTCNCQVIYSENKIGSPIVSEPDAVIALNQPSVYKFEPMLKKNGVLLYEATLVTDKPTREDITSIGVPAVQSRMGNMFLLGAYLQVAQDLDLDTIVKKTFPEKLTGGKAKFIGTNIEVIKEGMDYIKQNYPDYK